MVQLAITIISVVALAILFLVGMNSGITQKFSPKQANQTKALAIIQQGSSLAGSLQLMSADTGLQLADLTLDGAALTGLWGPDGTVATPPPPLTKSLTAAADWSKAQIAMPGQGTELGYETVLSIPNVPLNVCLQLNVEKGVANPAPDTAPTSTGTWGGAGIIESAAIDGKSTGCVSPSADNYTAFQVVESN